MRGKVPSEPHSKMESFRFLAMILSWILSGTLGNLQHSASLDYKFTINLNEVYIIFTYPTAVCAVACAGSVVLTQTHPAATYVCRTDNTTLRCQYDGVENVLGVVWVVGVQTTSNPSTIPGHTALPRTTTYQEVVVDSYTNLAAGYRCAPTLSNGSRLQSNTYIPQVECECCQTTSKSR